MNNSNFNYINLKLINPIKFTFSVFIFSSGKIILTIYYNTIINFINLNIKQIILTINDIYIFYISIKGDNNFLT